MRGSSPGTGSGLGRPDETSFVAAGLITDWPQKSPRALAGRFLRETGVAAVKYGGFRTFCGYTVAAYSRPPAAMCALFVHAKLLIARRRTIIAQVSAFFLPLSGTEAHYETITWAWLLQQSVIRSSVIPHKWHLGMF